MGKAIKELEYKVFKQENWQHLEAHPIPQYTYINLYKVNEWHYHPQLWLGYKFNLDAGFPPYSLRASLGAAASDSRALVISVAEGLIFLP